MKIARKWISEVTEAVMELDIKQAVKYVSTDMVIKATPRSKARKHVEIVVSIGKPNYAEKKVIKQALMAGEPFPIKKVQLKWNKR